MPETLHKRLSDIHKASFISERGWSAEEIQCLLQSPHVFVVDLDVGFLIGRVVADEAELLTVAVLPEARGRGIGAKMLRMFEKHAAEKQAARCFLEVAEDNVAARALYEAAGWSEVGKRPSYYARPGAAKCAALLLAKPLT